MKLRHSLAKLGLTLDNQTATLALLLATSSHSVVRRLVAAAGNPVEALDLLSSDLLPATLDAHKLSALVNKELKQCARAGVSIILPTSPLWLPQLSGACRPPAVVFVRGLWPPPNAPRIAMVGSRKATDYGRRMARTLATELGEAGATIVSGGASGIDAACHEAALHAAAPTIAVLGSSLVHPYPSANRKLFEEITHSGALLSEYPSVLPVAPYRFPERNRLLVAISQATVVVQCPVASGAMHTARFAIQASQPLFAVPGPADDCANAGSNALLDMGARPASPGRVASIMAPGKRLASPLLNQKLPQPAEIDLSILDPLPRKVLSALAEGVCHMDDLGTMLNASPAALSEALLHCELNGWIQREAGNRYGLRINVTG